VGRSSRSEGELRKLAASYLGRNLGGFYSSRKSTTTFFPSDEQHGSYPPKSISRLADHSIRNLSFEACHPSDSSFELQWRRTNLKFRSDLGKQSKLAMLVLARITAGLAVSRS
jgi:hypothetical protein